MADLSEYNKNALAFHLIDVISSASPSEVVRVLKENGFADQFPYGDNTQQAIIILQQMYIGNPEKFIQLVRQMKIDQTQITPANKEAFKDFVAQTNPSARVEWLSGILDTLTPKTTTGGGETITEETTGGAYVAYVVIVLAVIGLTIYMFRTLK